MAEIRTYITIIWTGAGAPTETQWRDFFQAMRNQTLSAAILAVARAAHNQITPRKRSLDSKIPLVGFEIDSVDRAVLLTILNTEAADIGVSGPNLQKFEAVLQAEVRQGALDSGATQAQADNLVAEIVGIGDRAAASAGAQQYLRDATALWHEVE